MQRRDGVPPLYLPLALSPFVTRSAKSGCPSVGKLVSITDEIYKPQKAAMAFRGAQVTAARA